MTWFRDALVGFRDVGSLLIKKGTVMGPLVPLLFVAFVFVLAAWLFRSVAMLGGVPILSAVLVLAAVGVVFSYLLIYVRFAKHDPDRLQSEEYRLLKVQQMIVAKDLQHPLSEGSPPLLDSMENPVESFPPNKSEDRLESGDTEEEREP